MANENGSIATVTYDSSNLLYCDGRPTSNGNGYNGPLEVTILAGETTADFQIVFNTRVEGSLVVDIGDNSIATEMVDCCIIPGEGRPIPPGIKPDPGDPFNPNPTPGDGEGVNCIIASEYDPLTGGCEVMADQVFDTPITGYDKVLEECICPPGHVWNEDTQLCEPVV